MNDLSRLPVPTKQSIVAALDMSRDMLTKLAEARDASLRLYREASHRAVNAEDRLERLTVMLAAALGYPSHAGKTPEALAIEVEMMLRALRGEDQR